MIPRCPRLRIVSSRPACFKKARPYLNQNKNMITKASSSKITNNSPMSFSFQPMFAFLNLFTNVFFFFLSSLIGDPKVAQWVKHCSQVWWPEFDPWKPCGRSRGRGRGQLVGCPLTTLESMACHGDHMCALVGYSDPPIGGLGRDT